LSNTLSKLSLNCQLQIEFAYYNYEPYIRAIPEHIVNFFFCLRTRKTITICSRVAPTFFAPSFVATNARKQNLNSLSLVAFLILAKKDVLIFFSGSESSKAKSFLNFTVYTKFIVLLYRKQSCVQKI